MHFHFVKFKSYACFINLNIPNKIWQNANKMMGFALVKVQSLSFSICNY